MHHEVLIYPYSSEIHPSAVCNDPCLTIAHTDISDPLVMNASSLARQDACALETSFKHPIVYAIGGSVAGTLCQNVVTMGLPGPESQILLPDSATALSGHLRST